MTRRDALSLISRVAGTTAGQMFFSGWLAAAHEHSSTAPPAPDRWRDYRPAFFLNAEFESLDHFTAVLLPTDETPGAREANVAPFIDFLLSQAGEYAPEMQQQWRDAVGWLTSNHFSTMTASDQNGLLLTASQPGSANHAHFQLIKDLSVYAFYTSRVGLIDNLEYKGLAYLTEFPGCAHPEHQSI